MIGHNCPARAEFVKFCLTQESISKQEGSKSSISISSRWEVRRQSGRLMCQVLGKWDALPRRRVLEQPPDGTNPLWSGLPCTPTILVLLAPVERVERIHFATLCPLPAHKVRVERRLPYPPLRKK